DLAVASNNPETPYAVFLASLRPGKAKGAAPLQEVKMGEPVLVYTGTKPPAAGAQTATESKPEKKKAAAVKPTAKDKDDASTTSAAASRAAPKPKPKSSVAKDGTNEAGKDGASAAAASSGDATAPKPKPKARKDAAKDGASATAASSDDATAPKPKPKKPAPKPPPMVITPAAEQSSQVKGPPRPLGRPNPPRDRAARWLPRRRQDLAGQPPRERSRARRSRCDHHRVRRDRSLTAVLRALLTPCHLRGGARCSAARTANRGARQHGTSHGVDRALDGGRDHAQGRVAHAQDDDAERQESSPGVSASRPRARRQVRRRAGAPVRPRTLQLPATCRPLQPLRPLGADARRPQGRHGLFDDAGAARIPGSVDRHHAGRRRGRAPQHPPHRDGAGLLHQCGEPKAHHRGRGIVRIAAERAHTHHRRCQGVASR